MLKIQYNWLRDFRQDIKDRLEYLVCDDGSRESPAKPPEEPLGMNFALYRIKVDVRWNQDAARNICAEHANCEWLLMTDQDHLIPEITIERVLDKDLDPTCVYRFSRCDWPTMQPYKMHPNSWLMTKTLFQRMGGYDERFSGWYGSDSDFRDRINIWCNKLVQLDEPLLRVPREVVSDASCPKSYGRKSPMDGAAIVRIKAERKAEKDPRPKRLTFPYERVV